MVMTFTKSSPPSTEGFYGNLLDIVQMLAQNFFQGILSKQVHSHPFPRKL
jgi:hypothetical protein